MVVKKLITGFLVKHTPPVVTVILAIAAGFMHLSSAVSDGFLSMKTEIVMEARQPAYAIIRSSLEKQTEKIINNPGDLKVADIKFLYNQCNDDFASDYLPTLEHSDSQNAIRTCQSLEDIYIERNIH